MPWMQLRYSAKKSNWCKPMDHNCDYSKILKISWEIPELLSHKSPYVHTYVHLHRTDKSTHRLGVELLKPSLRADLKSNKIVHNWGSSANEAATQWDECVIAFYYTNIWLAFRPVGGGNKSHRLLGERECVCVCVCAVRLSDHTTSGALAPMAARELCWRRWDKGKPTDERAAHFVQIK